MKKKSKEKQIRVADWAQESIALAIYLHKERGLLWNTVERGRHHDSVPGVCGQEDKQSNEPCSDALGSENGDEN